MPEIVANLRSMQRMGVFADRSARSPELELRRYNLIYGFNGSGKSTLSRLFASLESGTLQSKLPDSCSFEITMSDGSCFGWPSKLSGLERRVLVFNSNYVEQNLRWTEGFASPVFYIGADQADAATELAEIEVQISEQTKLQSELEAAERQLIRLCQFQARSR